MSKDLSDIVIDMPPDDAMQEIKDTCPTLTIQECIYVYWRIVGEASVNAFKKAGYAGSSWKAVETRPKIREAIAVMLEKIVPEHRVTRNTVVDILLEAVSIAREKSQAHNLVNAAVALADVTGVAAAAKIEVQQNVSVQGKIEHTASAERKMLQQLPRSELETLLQLSRTLPSQEVIDAEYEEIKK